MPRESPCPGCRLVLPERDGPAHPYIGASPACWALYGGLLAREYEDPAYFAAHRLSTDCYAVQHPGEPGRRSTQSVCVHLVAICLAVERDTDPRHVARVMPRLTRRGGTANAFEPRWLEPPRPNGTITVRGVLVAGSPDEHARLVRAWAEDLWRAWEAHHDTVHAWADAAGG